MSLRSLRLLPTVHQKSCYSRSFASIRGLLYGSRACSQSSSENTTTFPIPSSISCRRFHRDFVVNSQNARYFSDNGPSLVGPEESKKCHPSLVYEGPFSSLTLKLKRISLMSAYLGIVGLPAISLIGSSSVPATGQLAIIATAGLTAVGSTALLGYCFSPYVHTIERLVENGHGVDKVKITTRDVFARKIETIFDPTTDVTSPPKNYSRPFCNFMVKGSPMYVHPELVNDYKLRVQLLGEEPQQANAEMRNKKKTEDDEFL